MKMTQIHALIFAITIFLFATAECTGISGTGQLAG